jgi:PAS domain S-box-containing protein
MTQPALTGDLRNTAAPTPLVADALYQEILDNALAATGALLVVLARYEPERHTQRLLGLAGPGEGTIRRALEAAQRLVPGFDPFARELPAPAHGPLAEVCRTRRALAVPFAAAAGGSVDPRIIGLGEQLVGLRHSYLCPLTCDGDVKGILVFHTAAPLTERERTICDAFARQARLTLENARLAAAQQASEDLLRMVVENAPVVLFAIDAQGIVTLSEGKALDAFGLRPGEVVGRSAIEMYAGEPEAVERIRRALAGEASHAALTVGTLTFDTRLQPVRDDSGAVTGVIGVAANMTEQVQATAAPRESDSRFRRLAERTPDLIYRYQLAPERRVEYVNPAATALTGYTPEEHYADPELAIKLIHPDDRAVFERMAMGPGAPRPVPVAPAALAAPGLPAGALAPRMAEDPVTVRWVRKDGRVIWVELRSVPVFDSSGAVTAIEGIAREVTAWVAGESERTQRQRLDGALLVARGVAHEVNNALVPLTGYAELLAMNPTVAAQPQLASYAAQIVRAGQAIAGKVGRLQRIIRLEELPDGLGPGGPVLDLERSTAIIAGGASAAGAAPAVSGTLAAALA